MGIELHTPQEKIETAIEAPIFKAVMQAAHNIGQPAWIVGGWVRDIFLNRPSKDIDIVTLGSGIDLAKATLELINEEAHFSVFENFGTAMIKTPDFELEFVGARKESYRKNSRKPIVENGTLEDDQKRRDFTVNALYISLNKENFGDVLDPFNGLKHLDEKLLITPLNPDITYSDDPLRMMRAVRFSSQLNFNIDTESFESIKRNAERLKIVSQERITEEFNKIMASPKPSKGLKLLRTSGMLEVFFPELNHLHGVDDNDGKKHKDNFYHTLEVVDNTAQVSENIWLRYAALFHDIAKPLTKKYHPKNGWSFHGHEFMGGKMVPKIFKRLKLPLDHKMKYVQKLVTMSARPIVIAKDEVTDSAVRRLLFDAGEDIEDLMMLCEADITTKNPVRYKRYLNNFKVVRIKAKEVEEKDHLRNFQPPISGELIIETFNLKPSRVIGDIKNSIKEAILEGEIENNFNQAFDFMLKIGSEMGLETSKQTQE